MLALVQFYVRGFCYRNSFFLTNWMSSVDVRIMWVVVYIRVMQ